jgi:hypothetical protein
MSLPRNSHITRAWRRDAIDVASHIGDINNQILWAALPLQEISNCIIQLEVIGVLDTESGKVLDHWWAV